MRDSYGEIFSDMVDKAACFVDRADIFRRLDIKRHQFYNVTNPNRETNSGNPYTFPTEWGVKGTNEFKDYAWIKAVCSDCKCICITPEEIQELTESDPAKALAVFQKILGVVKNEKG